jgi:hypothetical protein
MLVIINCCKKWRQYIKNAQHIVWIFIDQYNLKHFLINKFLNRRETRWWEKLSELNLRIEYRSSRNNFVDKSSRRLDYENIDENKILNLNKLILRNDEFWIYIMNEFRRAHDQFTFSIVVKKISQIIFESKTIRMKNNENDAFNKLNDTNTAQRATMTLIVRTKTSSSLSKKFVFTIDKNFFERES